MFEWSVKYYVDFINNFMLTFRQYLSEIFRGDQTPNRGEPHPDHPDRTIDKEDYVVYHHKPRGENGFVISDKTIHTSFMKSPTGDHHWEVLFSVGGTHSNNPTHDFPSDVTKRVFDHFSHFVSSQIHKNGKPPVFIYDTTHPKKHRIYQAGARRLGIKAQNLAPLDKELDRGGSRSSRRENEPWLPWLPVAE
jgi:hypothetical protein